MSALGREIRRLWGVDALRGAVLLPPAADGVASTFEQVTRERVDQLGRACDRVETKVNAILLCLLGAAVADLVSRVGSH